MSKKYDGWAMQKPEWNNYIDIHSFRRKRTQCIKEFEAVIRWNWRQAKRKVKVVPVEESS